MIFVISLSTFTNLSQNADAASPGGILICHMPPNNPNDPQTIEVGEKVLSVHLRHGDFLGSCEDSSNADTSSNVELASNIDTSSNGNSSSPEKVLICHMPPGNPDNPQNIEVGKSAVDAHLRHGDSLGSCEFFPDRDGDGVPDNVDECPDDFGLAELNGCPPDGTDGDMDGDGVPDEDDLCPDDFGLAELNGCPPEMS